MIAVDTNILVYSENRSAPLHHPARALLRQLAEGQQPWAIPWPCAYEFLRVITHPRALKPPIPLGLALDELRRHLESPSLRVVSETARHFEVMNQLLRDSQAIGNTVFDAHIAAICVENGVDEILTADRDFSRFPLKSTNPFA